MHAKFQVNSSKIWVDVFLERDFPSGSVRRHEKTYLAVAKKRAIRKRRNSQGEESACPASHLCKKKLQKPMYMHKIRVCNVTTYSYNRGPPRGALYLGNIDSVKNRCVSNTCEKKFRTILWVLSYDTHFTSENPGIPVVGVFPENQRSKYSKTSDSDSSEDFRRSTGVYVDYVDVDVRIGDPTD